jgi:hypothetical protein
MSCVGSVAGEEINLARQGTCNNEMLGCRRWGLTWAFNWVNSTWAVTGTTGQP